MTPHIAAHPYVKVGDGYDQCGLLECGEEEDHIIHKLEGVRMTSGLQKLHEFKYVPSDDDECSECGRTRDDMVHTYFKTPSIGTETIAEEASRIVYGDREKTYDDPNRNFRKLAYMLNGVLDGKLKPTEEITPNDVALILICLKISRESFKPNRENRVDGIGYWLCLDRIVQEQERASE